MQIGAIPANQRFDPHTIYTFRRGPHAGRAMRFVGPAPRPLQDTHVEVCTADGQPLASPRAMMSLHAPIVCLPADLVPKV